MELPPGARFGCQSCGRCCQGWSVPVDARTVTRLRAHDWGGADPFEATAGGDEPFRIKLVDGRCFFLNPDNRCRIHAELSYEDKPAVCRAFPLAVLDVNGARYGRLSYWCPTVAENAGRPLEQQGRWLKDTAKHADRRTAPLRLSGERPLSTADFQALHRVMRRWVEFESLTIEQRLAAMSALVRLIEERVAAGEPVPTTVKAADSAGPSALLAASPRGRGSSGRRLLSLYLLEDRPPGRGRAIGRALAVALFFRGATRLSSRAMAASASWGAARRVDLPPSGAAAALVTRYLTEKISSHRYIAGDASVRTGINLLATAYGVASILARLKGASQGRRQCDVGDVRLALGAADLLVVEHAGRRAASVDALQRESLGRDDCCLDVLEAIKN
jgi:Fe-S-cluster containining protein